MATLVTRRIVNRRDYETFRAKIHVVTFVDALHDMHWAAMSPVYLERDCGDTTGAFFVGVLDREPSPIRCLC